MTNPPPLDRHLAAERPQDIPERVRRAVLDRDNAQCQSCGTGGENRLQLHHHAQYRSQGGGHTPENLVTVCFRCHDLIHRAVIDITLKEVWPGRWYAFRSKGPAYA